MSENHKVECSLSDIVFGNSLGEGKYQRFLHSVCSHFPLLLTSDLLGAFGNVRVGWVKTNKSVKYAIKTMKKGEIIKSKHVDHIENEKNILEKI